MSSVARAHWDIAAIMMSVGAAPAAPASKVALIASPATSIVKLVDAIDPNYFLLSLR